MEVHDLETCTRELLRVDAGVPCRDHRIRALGNTNPPEVYREAFKKLIGIGDE
jgi:hypothetical protein